MKSAFHGQAKSNKASRIPALPKGSRLLVIGNGMVGGKFCEYLTQSKVFSNLEVTVVGKEPYPAYDRINLSSYVVHQDARQLIFKSAEWYQEKGITLLTNTEAIEIAPDLKCVTLSNGQKLNYDVLVLATGSRPFVPPIEGKDSSKVFLYRNISDLAKIVAAAKEKERAAVIGGGLLGLEAAQAVQKLGLQASVIERASFLMPRQLNQPASSLLRKSIEAQGIELFLNKGSTVIQEEPNGLTLEFDKGAPLSCDLVIISAGITPNSELAKEAGLDTGLRGGIVVDNHFETSHPEIFAIGECALLDGSIYGLAAPGYAMARHLVARLEGQRSKPFTNPDLSTRLKMLGVDVVTIGDPLEEGRRVEFETDEVYRMLIIGPKGELKGGLGVGAWPEGGKIQSLYATRQLIRKKEEEYFAAEGLLLPGGGETPVAQWPDDRIVCNCMGVNKGQLVSCLKKCRNDPQLLANETGASTVCGSCEPLLHELCGSPNSTKPKGSKALLTFSSLALLAALITILAPPPAMADSVESWWYQVDKFWRESVIKQITGFSLMGIFLIGLLLSLRKRFKWFRFGHFAHWRVFHTIFGLTSLVALFVHTGFRFGHNLNFWLMLTFVGLNLLGAFAGILAALEGAGTSRTALTARRFRPILTYAHLALFWPLPVLLTFHILSVYLY
ncbi:FAD-dependent oxidoreductase [Roseibacillus persicicus]|uniref:FAD-dependent oxidoreductase n=1 Tax=Roseibacillus persicicus TaxID=454148 RepID=UPI00280F95D4|nr:FAD-dependent oxidoreductase [Roseibacillus persicicus]MDQ8192019.1 FAD-dependent oxidoreductase [Roseibacillus persicicus]